MEWVEVERYNVMVSDSKGKLSGDVWVALKNARCLAGGGNSEYAVFIGRWTGEYFNGYDSDHATGTVTHVARLDIPTHPAITNN